MDKKNLPREESDNLGSVIKHLIDYDAQQRGLISQELAQRDASFKQLDAERKEINKKYMQQAQKMLDALSEKQKQKAEREISASKNAAEKNIAELEKTAAEKSNFWIERIFERTISEQ